MASACGSQEPVSNFGILRKKRAVEIGTDHPAIEHTIGLVGIVVAVTTRRNHRAERLHPIREVRSARMVLIPHHRMRRERRGEHDVVDKAVGGRAGAARLDADDVEPGNFLVAEQPDMTIYEKRPLK